MKTPLLVVAKTLKHNKRQKRPREFHCSQNYPQSNKIDWRDPAAPAQPCEPASPSLSKAVRGQRQHHLALSASSICFFCLEQQESESPPFTLSLPLHGLVIPIYFWSCSNILVTQEMRGCGQSSRDDLLVQRAPAPPFHALCRRSVGRIHRRRRLPCHTHHTGATDTPTFRMEAESG